MTNNKKTSRKSQYKKKGQYNNLQVQSDTPLLADVFESFLNKWKETYEVDLDCLLWAP